MPTSLIRKLESIFPLSEDERSALESLPIQIANFGPDQDIVRIGDRPARCFLVQDGFTCSYKITGEGTRQILNFHISGDIPDLQSLHLDVLDHSISTITPCAVGFIPHEALHDLCGRHYRITSALWRETLVDAAVFREWIVNNGKREAYPAMAHLLCELVVRLQAVGLTQDHRCDLPITQSELADALGISTVHANRVLQDLRGAGLISLKERTLAVLDWDGLRQAGDFDPLYLHLEPGRRRPDDTHSPDCAGCDWIRGGGQPRL